jgi:hypothetical protein
MQGSERYVARVPILEISLQKDLTLPLQQSDPTARAPFWEQDRFPLHFWNSPKIRV